ncbi:MAG: CDP-alcohol phosphatidyltransferase family protein [Alphaproteobacteria bacterium]|nr:CDP-alcohol phosphatidyltransferase family protein [Alphaproteobacteria bacterium]
MFSVYLLKDKFQTLLRPLSDGCATLGLTANFVTISAFVLSCVVGGAVYVLTLQNALWYWLLPIALFLRMALNAVDGMMAREHNQQSALGAVLNELGDILSDCVIYVPFLYVSGISEQLILIFSILTIVSETVGVMGVQIGASRRYDGPMGKSDRAFWFGVWAAISAHCTISANVSAILTETLCFLLIYTIINRIYHALKEVKNK